MFYETFELVNANYYYEETSCIGNVTDIIKKLFDEYVINKRYTSGIQVSNDLFTDTCNGIEKKLFITINNKKNGEVYKYIFCESETFCIQDIYNELNNKIEKKIEVSIGEIVDKYSILDIKLNNITDENKIRDIKLEMSLLEHYIEHIKPTHLYKMILYINTLIWNDTDSVKKLLKSYDETDFEQVSTNATISNRIFENNQKRFRIKKLLNIIYSSLVKEHKSYVEEVCYIQVDTIDDIYRKIPEINEIFISYDVVYFNEIYREIIEKLFENYNASFLKVECHSFTPSMKIYNLSRYFLPNNIRDIFDFESISYVSGGRLGDFINQLSVICENYYNTGKKGVLYISNIADVFTLGLEYTYNDTYPLISTQRYIKEYKIHNGEKIDINLSEWRNYTTIVDWHKMYYMKYNVDWGKHRWIENLVIDHEWTNKVIINIPSYRNISTNALTQLILEIGEDINNVVFVSNSIDDYNHFCKTTKMHVSYYRPKDFIDTVKIINSCKKGFFGFSSPATIANALHKPHYYIGEYCPSYQFNALKGIIPHIVDIFI